jgi:DNA-nicking Smr family endonuclease
MTKGPRSKNTSTRSASTENDALWQNVADSAEPLTKGKNRVVIQPEPVEAPEPSAPIRKKKTPALAPRAEPASQIPPPTPPVANFDRKEARRLGSGRIGVDARIDLHGMRQREAHGSLKAFLARAQAHGHRHVLVITGKGGKREHDGSFERGVLNREVPRWLSEPEFRNWVVSFTPANKRHGGEGALYVRLRRYKSD